MAQYIGVKAINRSTKAHLPAVNSAGTPIGYRNVNPTTVTFINVDDPTTRRLLAHHLSLQQIVVVAVNSTVNGVPLPVDIVSGTVSLPLLFTTA